MAALDIPLPNTTTPPSPTATTLPAPSPWVSMPAEVFTFLAPSLPLTSTCFHPTDLHTPLHTAGAFRAGPATIMLLRYTATPVGPYDELLLIPGRFAVPATALTKLRVTRIYVSNPRSVHNGRANWNIPKRLARFVWTPAWEGGALPYEKVEVFAPGGEQPFFVAQLQSTWVTSVGVPLSTRFSPLDLELVAPPLREGEGEAECASEEWRRVMPAIWGRAGVVRGGLWGDGTGWLTEEEMRAFWGLGGWVRGEVTFGEGRRVEGAGRKVD